MPAARSRAGSSRSNAYDNGHARGALSSIVPQKRKLEQGTKLPQPPASRGDRRFGASLLVRVVRRRRLLHHLRRLRAVVPRCLLWDPQERRARALGLLAMHRRGDEQAGERQRHWAQSAYPPREDEDEVDDDKRTQYVPVDDSLVPHGAMQHLCKYAAHWRGVSTLSTSPPPGLRHNPSCSAVRLRPRIPPPSVPSPSRRTILSPPATHSTHLAPPRPQPSSPPIPAPPACGVCPRAGQEAGVGTVWVRATARARRPVPRPRSPRRLSTHEHHLPRKETKAAAEKKGLRHPRDAARRLPSPARGLVFASSSPRPRRRCRGCRQTEKVPVSATPLLAASASTKSSPHDQVIFLRTGDNPIRT